MHLNEEIGKRDELSFKYTVHFRPPTKVSLFTKVRVAKRHTMTINLCGKSANSFQDVLGLFSMPCTGDFCRAPQRRRSGSFLTWKESKKESIVAATVLALATRDFMKSEII